MGAGGRDKVVGTGQTGAGVVVGGECWQGNECWGRTGDEC